MPHNNIYSMKADISKIEANIDIEKLRLLVENIDNLLRLIPNTTSSITSISINMLYLLYCDKNKYLINIFLYEKWGLSKT